MSSSHVTACGPSAIAPSLTRYSSFSLSARAVVWSITPTTSTPGLRFSQGRCRCVPTHPSPTTATRKEPMSGRDRTESNPNARIERLLLYTNWHPGSNRRAWRQGVLGQKGLRGRKALFGLVIALCAAAVWAPGAAAASPKQTGQEVPAVGHPQVVSLVPSTTKPDRKAKTPGKPFLGANANGLAKAKGHAKDATSAPPPAPAPGPRAGIFNGTNQPGLSAADEGFCCTPPDPTGSIGPNHYVDSSGNFVFTSATIWAQPKPPAGNLTTCSATGLTQFGGPQRRLLNADGTSAFTPVPVNLTDAASTGYIVAGHSPVAPLPSDPNGPQTRVMLWHTTLQGGQPRLFADGDLTVGSFDVPASAPQPGGGPVIDTLDARLTQAVGHSDPDAVGAKAIWMQHTIAGPGGRSVARWYEILPATSTIRQQGAVQSATDFIWNASISPSISGNDAAIFYNRGSATNLVVTAAQSRTSAIPLSALNAGELVLATSSDIDVDFSCSSPYGPPCRWGDYSGASPDPINAGVVWGTNQTNGPSFFGFPQWETQNYAVTTSGTPPPPPVPCTSVTWNAPSPASPQGPGTQVTFSGTAAGCPHPVYEFWVQPPAGSWSILQAYSSASTATWNTTGLAAGTYLFDVWAKDSGSIADWDAHVSPNPTYTLQIPNTCTAVTWNAPSPASPQAPGATVTLGGTASGC